MYNPKEIETVVTVQYRTPDGVVHDTLEEALGHTPVYRPEYKLWAANEFEGVFETDDIEQAGFVYCPNARSADDFINDCQSEGNTVDGIDGEGWYTWDSYHYTWVLMPEGTISLFKNFLL